MIPVLFLLCTAIAAATTSTKPNILFILADDLGYNELGFMNNTRGILSPHLDALANSGVILKNYYVQPICSPTRSALMTGRYPLALGTQANVIYWDTPWAISLDNKFLPQYLQDPSQDLHYETAMYGKWHLGMYKEAVTPWKRGFDHHAGYLQGCGSGWTHVAACCHASATPTEDKDFICPHKSDGKDYRGYDWFTDGVPDVTANGTRTAELIRKHAVSFLNNRQNLSRPFFLYLPFQNIHGPYDAPLTYVDLYANRTDLSENEKVLFGYISEMDAVVGDVVATLHSTKEYENTLIIFSSDNGAPPAEEVRGRNWPLRGFKSEIWEGGVKVPGFVSGGSNVLPDQVRGTTSHALYHITDWLPTLLHVVGSDVKDTESKLDGMDVWDSISTGSPSPRTEMVYNINPLLNPSSHHGGGGAGPPKAGMRAVINGTNFKLLTYCYSVAGHGGDGNYTGPVTPSSFPPRHWPKGFGSVMLFDLDNDPSETMDVSKRYTKVVDALLVRLSEYATMSVEPMQWVKPFQGKDYECAECPLREGSHGDPNVFWTPWIKDEL